ncbi:efflux RND transporter periplasmic adaptor subunit [Actinoplanes sp. CA-252034]|uniref:efflux RND transporter periplasmic adaptor subunit n=1 Tax=Actinoplanes sp. CA-252034 TaxID=3239906 RepID=UPI003D98DAFA
MSAHSHVRRIGLGLIFVLLVTAGIFVFTRHRSTASPDPGPSAAAATAKLERRDLNTSKTIPGTIGYGNPRAVEGHKEATVTWLPAPGASIKRGQQLYRADDRPVTLFYGGMPLYRSIEGKGLVGRDVQIVADNLGKLGYSLGYRPRAGEWVTPVSPPASSASPAPSSPPPPPPSVRVKKDEGVLTAAMITAIKKWQRDVGLPETGAIAVGDVEVLSGAVRVESVAVQPGAPANGPLMSVTPTRKVITVAATLTDAASIERGAAVTVILPDSTEIPARVLSVGRTLAAPEGSVGDSTPQLTVTVTVDDPATLAKLDSAEVTVGFTGKAREDVLAAPVEALIALSEGGYAVQTPAGLVAVTTGMFAQGWVEVTGDGLAEGTDVVVAS